MNRNAAKPLVDDLHDATRPGIDQHGLVVHNGIAIIRRTVLGGNVIVGDPSFWQDGPNADGLAIMKRRMVLFDHVVLEARTLIDTEYTGYPASDGPDRPTDRAANR